MGDGKGEGKGEGKGQGEGKGEGEAQPPQDQDGNPARKRLEAAEQRMREAEQKLKDAEREGAVAKQEEALRELEKAKAELEEILRQLREEEIMRMLAMLEARFRRMLKDQVEVYEGTKVLHGISETEGAESIHTDARRLSDKELKIVVEADKALALFREDGTAVVFPEAVEQIRDDMQQVALRLQLSKVAETTQVIEEDIIAALKEMIEALQKAQEEMEEKEQKPGKPQEGQPQDPPLVDILAEIKMIRALQMRVNRRTDTYSKLIDGEQAENPEIVELLKELGEREKRIVRVTRDLEMGRNK